MNIEKVTDELYDYISKKYKEGNILYVYKNPIYIFSSEDRASRYDIYFIIFNDNAIFVEWNFMVDKLLFHWKNNIENKLFNVNKNIRKFRDCYFYICDDFYLVLDGRTDFLYLNDSVFYKDIIFDLNLELIID